MKKRQLITLGVMLAAVVLLFAGYSITKNYNEEKDAARGRKGK